MRKEERAMWPWTLTDTQFREVCARLDFGALGQVVKVARTRHMVCPSCKGESDFTYCGRQEWPHRAAMDLWNCPHCHSTISTEVGS